MSNIVERYLPAPIDFVQVELTDNEPTLGLYDSKVIVEKYIANGVEVRLVYGHHAQSVCRGIYALAQQGEKLSAIKLLRSQGFEVKARGQDSY